MLYELELILNNGFQKMSTKADTSTPQYKEF